MNNRKVFKAKTHQDRQKELRHALAKKAAQLKLEYDASVKVKPVDSSMIRKYHIAPVYKCPVDRDDSIEFEPKNDPYFDGNDDWESYVDEIANDGEDYSLQQNTKDLISDISDSVDVIRHVHKTNIENGSDSRIVNDFILEKLARIEVALEEIKDDQKKIIQLLSTPSESCGEYIEKIPSDCINFPIKTVEGVLELDDKCLNPEFASEFAKIAARYAPEIQNSSVNLKSASNRPLPGLARLITGLAQLFDDSVLIKFNWDGAKGRLAFCHLTKLNNILFGAWKSEKLKTFADYTASIRHQLSAAKGRRNQRQKRIRDNMIKEANIA